MIVQVPICVEHQCNITAILILLVSVKMAILTKYVNLRSLITQVLLPEVEHSLVKERVPFWLMMLCVLEVRLALWTALSLPTTTVDTLKMQVLPAPLLLQTHVCTVFTLLICGVLFIT